MRTTMMVVACMVLGAAGARATDIAGKTGIGAAVFNGGGEISLIHGHSARSAWLFDVEINQRSDELSSETASIVPPSPTTLGVVTFLAGPGFRRFSRPNDAFSPYWDIRVRGLYSRARRTEGQNIDTQTDSGAEGEFSFGLEYFTPWHFSVAAHTGLAQASLTHTTREFATPGLTDRVTIDSVRSSIGLSPVLYVRAYF